MRITRTVLLAMLLCLGAAAGLPALTIKMGSLAPTGSPWDAALHKIAAEWERISAGRVTLKLYSGGIAGDEPDMVRKIRIGQLGAAAITVSGLQGVFNGVKALSYPLFIRTDDELAYVLDHMKPFFDKEIEQRGFKVVMWSAGGWAYFYSRYPVISPADLKKQKLWVWVDDADEVQAWQSMGFSVVPLASTDIMTSLQGGMIDALATSPLLAASNQWFGIAPNMCALKLGPFWGAAIVSNKVWAEVPEDLQARLIDSAQGIADSLAPQITKADQDAIEVMGKYGLKINRVPQKAVDDWQLLVDTGFSKLIGKSFDRESFDMAKKYLDEYIAAHPRG